MDSELTAAFATLKMNKRDFTIDKGKSHDH